MPKHPAPLTSSRKPPRGPLVGYGLHLPESLSLRSQHLCLSPRASRWPSGLGAGTALQTHGRGRRSPRVQALGSSPSPTEKCESLGEPRGPSAPQLPRRRSGNADRVELRCQPQGGTRRPHEATCPASSTRCPPARSHSIRDRGTDSHSRPTFRPIRHEPGAWRTSLLDAMRALPALLPRGRRAHWRDPAGPLPPASGPLGR